MMRGENTEYSLPNDLIKEIFSRLPAKSIARFRCLSKLWGSIFRSPYFIDLFSTRSLARPPRFLIVFQKEGDVCFFSSPQPYEKSSSLVVTTDCHMKFRGDRTWYDLSVHTSGLILVRRNLCMEEYMICNPSTGQFASLPVPKGRLMGSTRPKPFLGFDPINKEFKVLSIRHPSYGENQILTLGTGNASWRKIHRPLNHYPNYRFADMSHSDSICINGVLYYLAYYDLPEQTDEMPLIACFDVRSEKYKFIHIDFVSNQDSIKLINYKGKLGVVTLERDHVTMRSMTLCLWIMKDVENPESKWSVYIYDLEKEDVGGNVSTGSEDDLLGEGVSIVGVTATGDIVLSMKYSITYVLFCVFYINPKTNTLQRVEIQGLGPIGDHNMVQVFIDYVEDLKFINTMTSISPAEQKRKPASDHTNIL